MPSLTAKTLFIINPAAGHHCLEKWRALLPALQQPGGSIDHAVATGPGHALTLAKASAATYQTVTAVGGDGTVFEVVNGLMASAKPPALAILPFGTGNDSARAVGINSENDALRSFAAGTLRPIDLIKITCATPPTVNFAMLFASVGITGDLLRHTTQRLKTTFGQRLAYLAGLLLALRQHSAAIMQVRCDDELFERRYVLACASNAETFGGGIRIAPGAKLDDGKLNVNLIESVGRIEALRHLHRLYRGRHTGHPKVRYRLANSISIATHPPMDVAADGELIGTTPTRFEVQPNAINVLTPGG